MPPIHECLQYANSFSTLQNVYADLTDSPITDDITVKYKAVEFDGRFWNTSVYRQPPSREVDDAWLALGAKGMSALEYMWLFANS